jgi:hypothetical protein
MKQITNPLTVITKLKTARPPRDTHGVTFALYAPGDATLYRVALVTMWPAEPESQLPAQTVLLVAVNGEMKTLRLSLAGIGWVGGPPFDRCSRRSAGHLKRNARRRSSPPTGARSSTTRESQA